MQIEEKKAVVSLQQIPDGFEINGDRQHLTNVFRNLIDNALKYSEHPPVIEISAKAEKDGILISFQDNGIGIPVSKSRLIFEKFQRIQDGQLHDQKGFGLGRCRNLLLRPHGEPTKTVGPLQEFAPATS